MNTFDTEDGSVIPEEELFAHYQTKYAATEPTHIANRLGLPFDYICERFSISFMGKEYHKRQQQVKGGALAFPVAVVYNAG